MREVDAETIARIALTATGHRSVSPTFIRWLTEFVEVVRNVDRGAYGDRT